MILILKNENDLVEKTLFVKMRLQLISDIHLEIENNFYPPKTGDSIVLLGDIGYPHTAEYQNFIYRLSKDYNHVFVIAGNHEYYRRQKTYGFTNNLIREFTDRFENVHFLDNNFIVIDGYRFVGCTLWSNIPKDLGNTISNGMNDYRQIKKYTETPHKMKIPITWHDTNAWHHQSVEFIKEQLKIAETEEQAMVVFTHHSPTFTGTDGPQSTPELKHAFSSDLDYLIKLPIIAWCYGHLHYSTDFFLNGVHITSNQRGYPGEETNFIPGKYIDI